MDTAYKVLVGGKEMECITDFVIPERTIDVSTYQSPGFLKRPLTWRLKCYDVGIENPINNVSMQFYLFRNKRFYLRNGFLKCSFELNEVPEDLKRAKSGYKNGDEFIITIE